MYFTRWCVPGEPEQANKQANRKADQWSVSGPSEISAAPVWPPGAAGLRFLLYSTSPSVTFDCVFPLWPHRETFSHTPNRRKKGRQSGDASETFACYLMGTNGSCDVVCWGAEGQTIQVWIWKPASAEMGWAAVLAAPPMTSGLNPLHMNAALWNHLSPGLETDLLPNLDGLEKQRLYPGEAVYAANPVTS